MGETEANVALSGKTPLEILLFIASINGGESAGEDNFTGL